MRRLRVPVAAVALAACAATPAAALRHAAQPAIVFVRGASDIWILSADGAVRHLTDGDNPRWGPGRRWIVFTRANYSPTPAANEIWLIRPDGSGLHQVSRLHPIQAAFPTFAHDGRHLLYVAIGQRLSFGGIWTIGIDGTGARRLTSNPGDSAPVLSRDGRRLAFVRAFPAAESLLGLYSAKADGRSIRRVLPPRVKACGDGHPAWSPDGRAIAFMHCSDRVPREGGEPSGIWVIGSNGRGMHRLVAVGQDPAWSPDGRWIAYAAPAGGTSVLFKIHLDGTGRTRLTRKTEPGDGSPDW